MHGGTLLSVLDHLGTAMFAARGALAVSSRDADLTATVFLAAVAAVGGGTTRDRRRAYACRRDLHPLASA